MKSQNKYLLNKRLKVLEFAKTVIVKKGLTSETLKIIYKENNLDLNEINLLFPEGNNDLIKFAINELNENLEKNSKKIDLIRLPLHKRIRKILLLKISLMDKEKAFYKIIFWNFLFTKKHLSVPKQLYKSIDQIWFIAGDTSVDFNFYTKRIILAGIYTRLMFSFFKNSDQKTLENLLDVNLKRVAKIPKIKSNLKFIKEYFPRILGFVKNSN